MNVASPNIKLALFCLLFLALAQSSFITCASAISEDVPHRMLKGLFPKTHVYINNTLGGGIQAKVHCVSDLDNDKGEHVVNDGETYEFEFTPSILDQNYVCDISFNDKTTNMKVYHYKRDWHRCFKHCRWRLAMDGVHGYNQDGQDDLHVDWEPKTN